jgi:hypothetical protein
MKKVLIVSLGAVLLGVVGNALALDGPVCAFFERNVSQFNSPTTRAVEYMQAGESVHTTIQGEGFRLTRTKAPKKLSGDRTTAVYELAVTRDGFAAPEAKLNYAVNQVTFTNSGYECFSYPYDSVGQHTSLPVREETPGVETKSEWLTINRE